MKKILSLLLSLTLIVIPTLCLSETITVTVEEKIASGREGLTVSSHMSDIFKEADGTTVVNSQMDTQSGKYIIKSAMVNDTPYGKVEQVTLNHNDYQDGAVITVIFLYKENPNYQSSDDTPNQDNPTEPNEPTNPNDNPENNLNDNSNDNPNDLNNQDDNSNDSSNNDQSNNEPSNNEPIIPQDDFSDTPSDISSDNPSNIPSDSPIDSAIIVDTSTSDSGGNVDVTPNDNSSVLPTEVQSITEEQPVKEKEEKKEDKTDEKKEETTVPVDTPVATYIDEGLIIEEYIETKVDPTSVTTSTSSKSTSTISSKEITSSKKKTKSKNTGTKTQNTSTTTTAAKQTEKYIVGIYDKNLKEVFTLNNLQLVDAHRVLIWIDELNIYLSVDLR